jgi:hypothetical protein
MTVEGIPNCYSGAASDRTPGPPPESASIALIPCRSGEEALDSAQTHPQKAE